MSLVSEALKKARNEAARREASERGMAYPTVPHHLPVQRPERRIWPWAVGSGALVALALGALAAVLAWRAPASPPAAVAAAPPPPQTAPAAVAERAVPAAVEVPRTETRAPAAAARERAPSPTPPVAAERSSQRTTSPATAQPPGAPVAPPIAASGPEAALASLAPAPPSPPAPLAFVRHAELPGGVRLDLGGIAFSSGQPVALINGRALAPREQIQGYTLTAIEPDVVWLEKGDVRVRLALKD